MLSGDYLGPWRPFQRVPYKVKVIFLVLLRHYLLPLFSFSHECLVEFSGDSKTCDIARLNPKANMRTQLFLSSVKEIYKNATVTFLTIPFRVCKIKLFCYKTILFMKTCKEFINYSNISPF